MIPDGPFSTISLPPSELADGRYSFAVVQDPDNADVVANQAVLAEYGAQAPGRTEFLEKLKSLAPKHPLVRELKEKDLAFEEALQKHQEALSGAA